MSATHSWFRALSDELALDQVSGAFGLGLRAGGAGRLGSLDPLEAFSSHEAFDRAAGDLVAGAAHLLPHLPGAIHVVVLLVHRGDRGAGLGQCVADRLDTVFVLVAVDELDLQRCGRCSSAAKKADVCFKIVFARRSSRFSFSSCARRASRSAETDEASCPRPGLCGPRSVALRVDAKLLGDPHDRTTRAVGVGKRFQRHPRRSLVKLIRVFARCSHDLVILPGNRCLHQTRGTSACSAI